MLETSRTHGLLKVIVPLSLILSYGPWPFPEKFTLSKQPLIFCYPSPPSMEKILLIKSVSPFPLHPWRKSSGSPFPLHPWRKSSSKSVSPFPLNLWLIWISLLFNFILFYFIISFLGFLGMRKGFVIYFEGESTEFWKRGDFVFIGIAHILFSWGNRLQKGKN